MPCNGLNLTLSQQNAEIAKNKNLLITDEEIISLSNKVKTISLAQLQNGVINSNDYLRQADAEDQARQNKLIHETQLLMSQYNQPLVVKQINDETSISISFYDGFSCCW